MKTQLAGLFLLSALLTTANAAPGSGDCVGILSGAVQGTFSCVVVAGYGFAPGVGVVSFTPARMPAGVQSVTAAFSLDGPPSQGEFTFPGCTDVSATVTRNDGAMFIARKKPQQGRAGLTVTSATKLFPTPDGTMYTVHGTIEAEMPQLKPEGSHGTVQMRVTF